MNPKVLVGIVTYSGKEYCLDKFISSLRNIVADCKKYDICEDVMFFDNSKELDYFNKLKNCGFDVVKCSHSDDPKYAICESYNILRGYFLENCYTHLFCLEQDVIPKPEIIRQLLSYDKKVCSGWYNVFYNNQTRPCVGKIREFKPTKEEQVLIDKDIKKLIDSGHSISPTASIKKYDYARYDELDEDRCIPVYFSGLGCVLIKKEVLEKICFVLVRKGNKYITFNDMQFYHDLAYCKIVPYVDTSLFCEHIKE